MTSWIQIYGMPEKKLTDNGESANYDFIDMCQSIYMRNVPV